MALEDAMERLTAALDRNTAARTGAPAATPPKTPPKPTGTKAITQETVRAALVAVMDAHGRPAAKKIINEVGKAQELNAIKPARFAAVLQACADIMEPEEATEEDATTEDDEL